MLQLIIGVKMYFKKLNKNLKKYFDILCDNDYPKFLNKYLETSTMKRLSGIGHFCGSDHSKFHKIKFWYSRLDHSVACALISWNFTKDKTQTLATLFHDLGTPAFSHTIDYMLGDYLKHESSEKKVKDIIFSSKEIKENLKKDKIKVKDIISIEYYPISENKRPKLCIDRLEGIIPTAFIWEPIINLKDIKKIYKNLVILKNEEGKDEIGFKDVKSAEYFFEIVYKVSMLLVSNEDKIVMKLLSDIIKESIKKNIISFEELYILSEKDILKKIKKDKDLKILLNKFINLKEIYRSKVKPKDYYYISFDSKKRHVIPLCLNKNREVERINKCSKKSNKMLNNFLKYKDSKYCYVKNILMNEFK